MIRLFEILAFSSALILFYVYVGYFIILLILRYLLPERKVDKKEIYPYVSLLISCYNEEAVIREKLENSLSLDYPKDKIEIIVISDASTDHTDEIVLQFENRGVRLIRQEDRQGKTLGLNLAVSQAKGEIIVFSDANAMYQPDAIRKLVRNFHDTNVGYVVGESRYTDADLAVAAKSECLYWQYETWLKRLESHLKSVVGGDGAIYAIRRELYERLAPTDINDFVNPLQIVAKGFRGVYEPEAISREETAGNFQAEFQRKIRIVNRSLSGLFRVKAVLNPFKTGTFSLEIISHKLLRWLSPVFIITLTGSCLVLALCGIKIFAGITIFIILFLWLSYFGHLFRDHPDIWPLFYYPYYFVSINVASLIGIYRSLRGSVQTTWKPLRIRDKAEKKKPFAQREQGIHVLAFISGLLLLLTVGKLTSTFLINDKVNYLVIAITCCIYSFYSIVLKLRKERMPGITLLVYVYNEEDAIVTKIKNSLEMDYPSKKLKVVIVSDGSSDSTNVKVRQYKSERLILKAYPLHRGGREVINDTVRKLTDEIIILSDTNTIYQKDIIKKLVQNFHDPTVWGVSNNSIIKGRRARLNQLGLCQYINSRFIRKKKLNVSSINGLRYNMYAFRREMFDIGPVNIILDAFIASINTSYSLESYRKTQLYK
ncbi:MAG: glycosyltransferase [Nitrospirota bacterium]